jgi:hypothetical protein
MFSDDGSFEVSTESRVLPLRTGVDYSVEDETEKLLADDRRELREQGLDVDYLTTDQLLLRWSRELIGPYGTPDRGSVGMYRRAYNPCIGQRPTNLSQEN